MNSIMIEYPHTTIENNVQQTIIFKCEVNLEEHGIKGWKHKRILKERIKKNSHNKGTRYVKLCSNGYGIEVNVQTLYDLALVKKSLIENVTAIDKVDNAVSPKENGTEQILGDETHDGK